MGLDGLRVLLIEDDSLVALAVEDMLGELGCVVSGLATALPDAVEKVQAGDFDFALLDVNLRGEEVFPVARILADAGIPFAFASGYGVAGLPDSFRSRPIVSKPFQLEELSSVLSSALAKAKPRAMKAGENAGKRESA